jgi:hypothetical protein
MTPRPASHLILHFWSFLLVFREPGFDGTFSDGSRHVNKLDSDWCLFPAMLGTGVRFSFFGLDQKNLEEWIQSRASCST